MWCCGGSRAACEAVNAEVARTRLSDSLPAEVLFAAGWVVVELRRSQALRGVGEKTVQKLEAIGAMTFPAIAQMTDEQFIAAGISRKIGNRIRAYVRRRIR